MFFIDTKPCWYDNTILFILLAFNIERNVETVSAIPTFSTSPLFCDSVKPSALLFSLHSFFQSGLLRWAADYSKRTYIHTYTPRREPKLNLPLGKSSNIFFLRSGTFLSSFTPISETTCTIFAWANSRLFVKGMESLLLPLVDAHATEKSWRKSREGEHLWMCWIVNATMDMFLWVGEYVLCDL